MASPQKSDAQPAVPTAGGSGTPPPAPGIPPPVDGPNQALDLVLFGLPGSGKSSLLGALARVTPSAHGPGGRFVDVTGTLGVRQHHLTQGSDPATSEEINVYPVTYEPPDGEGLHANIYDCDGRLATALIQLKDLLGPDTLENRLAHAILQADTVIVTIDASAGPVQMDVHFKEFSRFLRQFEERRGQHTEVGGLPVFLVLTKCDQLARPGDSYSVWIDHIEERKQEVHRRFKTFLTRRDGEPELPFGRLDLHVWATAASRPALAGKPAQSEPHGVAELFQQCFEEADYFRGRRKQADRRLRATVGGAGVLVLLLFGLMLSLLFGPTPPAPSNLEREIDAFRYREGTTTAERLRGSLADVRERLKTLRGFRSHRDFNQLPQEMRAYVQERIAQFEAYASYFQKLQDSRSPTSARNEATLAQIEKDLTERLTLPDPDWKDTVAGKLREGRLGDIKLIREQVNKVEEWYLTKRMEGLELWTFSRPPTEGGLINWRGWQDELTKYLKQVKDPPPAVVTLPETNPLVTPSTILSFDRVVKAREDLLEVQEKLEDLRDIVAVLGLLDPTSERPALLAIPRPPGFTLRQTQERFEQMKTFYPRYEVAFQLGRVPDDARTAVIQATRTSYDYLLDPARVEVLSKLGGAESEARWQAVREWLDKDPEELRAWRQLAVTLQRLAEGDARNPVDELARFLAQTSFTIDVVRITLEIPDGLKKPVEGAPFVIHHGDRDLRLPPAGTGERDAQRRLTRYRFELPEQQRLHVKPGDRFDATLPLRDDQVLTWHDSRTRFYRFECLVRGATLHRKDQAPEQGDPARGVNLIVSPASGVPRIPDLLPTTRR
jgi:GTPase SAR1 family protein